MSAWTIVYRVLWAAFFFTAALNMAHVRGGFLTNYLADLTVPALLYVISRGLVPTRPWSLMNWLGRTPERAAAFFFLASTATELSQIAWPRGIFAGRFDPWDIVAYGVGIAICYGLDKQQQARAPKGAANALIVFAALSAVVHAQSAPAWPDTYTARLEALALIQTLNAEILGSRSATAVLETWCRDHQLASEPKILAHALAGASKAPTAEQRRRLDVSDRDEVKHRRVQLRCGTRVLSEADNWYVPGRLTPEMNRLLETTPTPFGKAVESLEPYRRTVAVRLLWAPLPAGWAQHAERVPAATNRPLDIPAALFEHRAVLYTRDHRPFSEVVEVYQRQLLEFPPKVQ